MRSEEAAILVGTTTVLQDNPSLTVRDWAGSSPKRIIIDRTMKIPSDFSVFDETVETIIFTEKETEISDNLIIETINFSEALPKQICDRLFRKDIQSVIIEGGAKMLQTFIDANLWDEAFVFTGKQTFTEGIKAPFFKGEVISEIKIKGDSLQIFKNFTP
jgi:diaminohydroxyphosphoribosylaminopyrimidine deaminase/5-amino-6-(5-phosphoribosylamino)uracil reductase